MNIIKDDKIIVISGKDNGKTGKVIKTFPKINKVIIGGINISKKHLKKSQKNPYGGIVDIAMPINRSNVQLICPRCDKKTKISYKLSQNNKTRICNKCHETVDNVK